MVSDAIVIAPDTGTRALVIEDVPSDRARIDGMLKARGLEPLSVETLEEAHAAASGGPVGVIVLSADVRNGFNLCLKLRKDPVLKGVPLVMTTAKAGPDVIEKHQRLPTRADEYVRKPLDEDSLGEVLDRLLGADAVLEIAPDDDMPPDLPAAVPAIPEPPPVPPIPPVPDADLDSPALRHVEDEIHVLRDAVSRLEREKAELNGRVGDLASELEARRDRPDTGRADLAARFEALATELAEARSSHQRQRDEQAAQAARLAADLEAARERNATLAGQLDAARASAQEVPSLQARIAALEAERDALARQVEADRAFAAEIEPLRARLSALDEEREALAEREAKLQSELEQTTQFFERLEAGYKDSLAVAQAEKAATEEARDRAEQQVAELAEKAGELARVQATLPALHEAAARAELLQKELEAQQAVAAEAEQLRSRLAALEAVNHEMEVRLSELDAANQAQAAQIGKMVRMKREFVALRQSEAETRQRAAALAAHLDRIRAAVADETGDGARPEAPPPPPPAVMVSSSRQNGSHSHATREDPVE